MSRILYVLDYLSHNTDAEKGATLKEIQAYLLNQTNLGAVSVLSIKRLAYDSKASYMILSLMDRENPVLNSFHIEGTDTEKEDLQIKE